ncbi:serine protease [Streptomyces sp. NBC_00347]|uniref:serine protease n=1 Tax=Streptomyces sp. NBC_00347 TaxID=2975721 RepID=UPI0022527A5C|nr:serine protease [Streptomyces sp. NBC_00347]MCX5122141.1 serine protease [Streptomyces sp. NBC_00347]
MTAELIRICDLAGRPRGSGFVADDRGTVLTSHEAVDGLARVVLHGPSPGERTWLAGASDVTALPELGLALVRSDGLGVRPLPVAPRGVIAPGTYVRLSARGWRQARVLGGAEATYAATSTTSTTSTAGTVGTGTSAATAADRLRRLPAALELAIGTDGRDALRLGGEACGGPVLDAATGAVLAVLCTALQAEHRSGGFAVPLTAAAAADPGGPLAALLERNAATVPGHGADLNLAGALQLTGTTLGAALAAGAGPEPVDRPEIAAELDAFTAGDRCTAGDPPVLALVGRPGTGRTTALAALAVRRARGPRPAPTLWLRGSDLRVGDTSLADAVARALAEAGRILEVPAAAPGPDPASALAAVVASAGRALLVVLDGPEEMPPRLAALAGPWTAATAAWLDATGARLVLAARPEYWESAGRLYPSRMLRTPARPARRLPPAVPVGDLTPEEAALAGARLGIPADAVAGADARHPLTLRLLAEVRAAGVTAGRPSRDEVFAAHLDLLCLRVAVRVSAALPQPRRPGVGGAADPVGADGPDTAGVHGPGVGRLAARVAGRVHEAARRCLGPGQGQVDRASFEELFPWRSGWASAVLTEGLLVPAGEGYRFAHEELADWVQAAHLDLPAALETLGRDVPRHRIGPVLEALGLLPTGERAAALERLVALLDAADGPEARWWAARLLGETLLRVPDATPYLPVLYALTTHLTGPAPGGAHEAGPTPVPVTPADPAPADPAPVDRTPAGSAAYAGALGTPGPAVTAPWAGPGTTGHPWIPAQGGAPGAGGSGGHAGHLRPGGTRTGDVTESGGPPDPGRGREDEGEFGAWFWTRLRVAEEDRFELLRRMLPHDHRLLDAAARRLVRAPHLVQPLLCGWFRDERRLLGRPGATVATAAQALLHTHRHLAVDDLAEALVTAAHPRADELLAVLAEDEPSALSRAVDRWAHDERPGRRVAAAAYGPLTAPHVRTPADRELLRYAAQALLARPGDASLHGSALGILLRDPQVRARYLPEALACFRDPGRGLRLPAAALVAALPVLPDPDAVFAALRERADGEVVRALAALTTPGLARRAADLVRDHLARHPQDAAHAAAFVDRRLEQGLAAAPVLRPLVRDLLGSGPPPVRAALAGVLAAPGTESSYTLRGELAEALLREELDPSVLDAFLGALAAGAATGAPDRTRDLLRRTGRQLLRAPGGPAVFERRTVELARAEPAFGALVARWLERAPQEAAALLGPSARRTVETLAHSASPRDDADDGQRPPAWQS